MVSIKMYKKIMHLHLLKIKKILTSLQQINYTMLPGIFLNSIPITISKFLNNQSLKQKELDGVLYILNHVTVRFAQPSRSISKHYCRG